MYSRGVANASASTKDGFSLSGYSDGSVFFSDASVTAAVVGCRGRCVMAGSLNSQLVVNVIKRERETVRSGSSWLRAQALAARIMVTKSNFNLMGVFK